MDARKTLGRYGAVYVGGQRLFVSTTGKLLTGYVNCEVIYPHYEVTRGLTEQLVEPFLGEVDCFVCPSTGDIVLVQYATFVANLNGFPTTTAWADKQSDNSYVIERSGFRQVVKGKRVLVLNDRISQGGTTRKVIDEVRRCGGEVIGASTLAGVSSLSAESFGIPRLHALCNIDVQAFMPEDLPQEMLKWPIVLDESLGHGADYQRDHADNPHPGGYTTILG